MIPAHNYILSETITILKILKADHMFYVAAYIWQEIEEHDDALINLDEDGGDTREPEYETVTQDNLESQIGYTTGNSDLASKTTDVQTASATYYAYHNFKLGSQQAACTFQKLEKDHENDVAFSQFRPKLAHFLAEGLQAANIPLPDNKYPRIESGEKVSPLLVLYFLF